MPPPPNILLLLPDQHRGDWLGCNPELPLRTPNLDRLSASGTRFTQALTPSPLCAPARACLASGRSYEHCGVRNNGQDYPLDQKTYYAALRDAGYRVGGVGKFDLHKATRDWGTDGQRCLPEWGFTDGLDNEGKFDGSGSYLACGHRPCGPYLAFLQARGLAETYAGEHAPAFRGPRLDAYTTALPDDAYCDNWVAENGLRVLSAFPRGRPWHLVVNFTGPHNPMDVTASMRARWEAVDLPEPHRNDHEDRAGLLRVRQNYAAMIENLDRHVGRFVDLVTDRGELGNTLVVYSSDHGEMLGDHGRWGKSFWRRASVSIPLIMRTPGGSEGRVSPALVSLHDLCATFLDYAGIPADALPGMDARSLRPLLDGRTRTHRQVVASGLDTWRMWTDGAWKLVLPDAAAEPLLFELSRDPHEDRNVAEQYPDQVARLRQAWRDEPWESGFSPSCRRGFTTGKGMA
jgi:arylsulfatase A-like enzyme